MAQLKRARQTGITSIIACLAFRETGRDWQLSLGWQQSSLNEIYMAARKRAQELGYQLEPFYLNEPGMTGQRLTKILFTRNIHGVVVSPREQG